MTNVFETIKSTVKHWYIPLIVGLLFIILGFYVITVPLQTYVTLSIFFSISFIVLGGFDIYFAINNRKSLPGWSWNLAIGILSLLMGIYLIMKPEVSITTLPLYVGFVLMFNSIKGLSFSFELKEMGELNWGSIAIISLLSLLLSFLLIANPVFTGISLVTLTSLSFIMFGVSGIVFSFRLKKIKDFPNKAKAKVETETKTEESKQGVE